MEYSGLSFTINQSHIRKKFVKISDNARDYSYDCSKTTKSSKLDLHFCRVSFPERIVFVTCRPVHNHAVTDRITALELKDL